MIERSTGNCYLQDHFLARGEFFIDSSDYLYTSHDATNEIPTSIYEAVII